MPTESHGTQRLLLDRCTTWRIHDLRVASGRAPVHKEWISSNLAICQVRLHHPVRVWSILGGAILKLQQF